MRKLIFIAFLILVFVQNANATYTLYGSGGTPCGEILSKQNNIALVYQYKQWLLGFISGRNYENDRVYRKPIPDPDGIYHQTLKFCRDNPLETWANASERTYVMLK